MKALRGRVPPTWTVIVLADCGWYAQWLFEAIVQLGGHPMLRVTIGGSFRPEGGYHWRPFRQLVPAVGRRWQGYGMAFTHCKTRLNCTLLGSWDPGHDQPWLILTDVPPQAADACGYGLRAWIKQGFKKIKSGGWQWQYTRMTDPNRVERLWLAIAIATGWLLSVGGEARSDPPDCDVSRGARFAPTARSTLAAGGNLPAWLVVDDGDALQLSETTHRPWLPRTLAGLTHRPLQPTLCGTHRRLMRKTYPCKGG